jgi:molybdopterin synthase catalytic subunit
MITVRVQPEPFSVADEMARLRNGRTDIGAIVTFTGLVRQGVGSAKIDSMTLEHYPAMTEKELQSIADTASRRWDLLGGVVIHRYGELKVGEEIVLVGIASAHRQAAFESAMFLMDWLKTKAPFWKKESGREGAAWVEAKVSDEAATKKW